MNELFAGFTVGILGWFLSLIIDRNIARVLGRLSYEQLKWLSFCPYLVHKALKNIEYITDMELYSKDDYWAAPRDTWHKKAGDCEDYALLSIDLLKPYRYDYWLVVFRPEDTYVHVIAVVTRNYKKYYLFDISEATLKKIKTNTSGKAIANFVGGKHYQALDTRGWNKNVY